MSLTDQPNPLPQSHPTGERRAELERIRDAVWPPDESPEQRAKRIRKAVAVIDSILPPPYHFDSETWKYIAQSPEVYDEE